jgi:prolyl 4-hydroxylase
VGSGQVVPAGAASLKGTEPASGKPQDELPAQPANERPVPTCQERLGPWMADLRSEGHGAAQIFNAAVAGGWSREAAAAALRHAWMDTMETRELDALVRGSPWPDVGGSQSTIVADGHEVQVLLAMHHPRVVLFGSFLADDECDELMEVARSRLERSTVVAASGGSERQAHVVTDYRTSHGTFLRRGEGLSICDRIDARAQALLNWPVDFTEELQVLRYDQGAQYKTHYDFFRSPRGQWNPALRNGGNRCGTLVIYLNTPVRGGGTDFPDVPMEVKAHKGAAVYFGYPVADTSSRTAHGGSPVIEGEKWAAVKWFRQGPIRFAPLQSVEPS